MKLSDRKLGEFPLIFKGLKTIMFDSWGSCPGQPMGPKAKHRVPVRWVRRFELAEAALRQVKNKKWKDFGINRWEDFEEGWDGISSFATGSDPVLELVYLPINTESDFYLQKAGIDRKSARAAAAIFTEFFDGSLANVFGQDLS